MPEHVHLLISEPERGTLASAIQAIKQSVSRRSMGDHQYFWQARYYDFNVWTKRKRVEKLCYLHRNPVKRGLVEKPEDWPWSSFRHYLTGEESAVEVESPWTDRKRERMGTTPRVKVVEPAGWGGQLPRPSTTVVDRRETELLPAFDSGMSWRGIDDVFASGTNAAGAQCRATRAIAMR
jgi:hypothetical protein